LTQPLYFAIILLALMKEGRGEAPHLVPHIHSRFWQHG
jgi:hypothetical protein